MKVFEVANVLARDIFSEITEESDILISKNSASQLSAEVCEIIWFSFQSLLNKIQNCAESHQSISFVSFYLCFS